MKNNEKAINYVIRVIKNLLPTLELNCKEINDIYWFNIKKNNQKLSISISKDDIDDLNSALVEYAGKKECAYRENDIKFQIYIALGKDGFIPDFVISEAINKEKGDWKTNYKAVIPSEIEINKVYKSGLHIIWKNILDANMQSKANIRSFQDEQRILDGIQRCFYNPESYVETNFNIEELSCLKAAILTVIREKEKDKNISITEKEKKAYDKEIYYLVERLHREPYSFVKLPDCMNDLIKMQDAIKVIIKLGDKDNESNDNISFKSNDEVNSHNEIPKKKSQNKRLFFPPWIKKILIAVFSGLMVSWITYKFIMKPESKSVKTNRINAGNGSNIQVGNNYNQTNNITLNKNIIDTPKELSEIDKTEIRIKIRRLLKNTTEQVQAILEADEKQVNKMWIDQMRRNISDSPISIRPHLERLKETKKKTNQEREKMQAELEDVLLGKIIEPNQFANIGWLNKEYNQYTDVADIIKEALKIVNERTEKSLLYHFKSKNYQDIIFKETRK